MSLQESINDRWGFFQEELFPFLRDETGPLGDGHEKLVIAIEHSRLEHQIRFTVRRPGRPRESRVRLARAFFAKSVFDPPTTRSLIDRLHCDRVLRQLCGWLRRDDVPSEATFSRAFAEFAGEGLMERVHAALVKRVFDNHIAGHLSRDVRAKAELHSRRRADRAARHVPAETALRRERSTVERFFGRLSKTSSERSMSWCAAIGKCSVI